MLPSVTPWGEGPLSVVVVDGEGSVSASRNTTFIHTTSPLGSNAEYQSNWTSTLEYATVVLTIFSDQAGVLYFQWSADGVNVDLEEPTDCPGNSGRAFSLAVRGRYLRIRYVNGGTAQTSFRLCSTLHQTGVGLISKPLTTTISDNNFTPLVGAVLFARDAGGIYRKVVCNTNGELVVSGTGGGGGLTDAQLRATPVPVSGTFFQGTQPVSAVSLPLPTDAATESTLALINTKTLAAGQSVMASSSPVAIASNQSAIPVTDNGGSLTVDGTFFQATQPISAASLPLPSGAATDASVLSLLKPSTLCVTGTAAVNTIVTLTLPAVAGQFHYITSVMIRMYATAARTGGTTPVVSTTTNLPGNPAFTWESAQAVGTVVTQQLQLGGNPLKSSVANTATTIVCPATANVIWRATVTYYAAT